MRSRRPAGSLVAVVLLASAFAPAPSGASRDRCRVPADASDVTRGQYVVAFRSSLNDLGPGLWACLRSERRRRYVVSDDSTSLAVDTFRVAGRYVAYAASSPPGCKADCPPDAEGTVELGVFNVAANRHRTVYDERGVGAIGLSRGGVLVWTALDQAGGGVVRMRARRSRRTLDRGAVDRTSLTVRGRAASWTNAGVPRRARLPAR